VTTAKSTNPAERAVASVSLTWYGQSGFRLVAGDSRLLIDPFLSELDERTYPPPAAAAEFADVTLVLSTHEHVDHLDLPFLREFCAVNAHAPIVVPAPVVSVAADAGIDPARLVGVTPGQELTEGGVTVHPLPALHGLGGDQPVAYEFAPAGGPVRFLAFVFSIGGIRFYHAGDGLVYRELPAALSALAPDVLMLPINGRDHMRESAGIVGNMNATEAAWLCTQVPPAYIIPMHYDAIQGNTTAPGHFADLVREAGVSATILIPALGHTFALSLP
jgi:L-ascorbate metabolism protein UlaG (beta-lactamase superfamily)